MAIALTLVLFVPSGGAGSHDAGPSGVHIAFGEDPSTTMVVQWVGPASTPAHVAYGEERVDEDRAKGDAYPVTSSNRTPYAATLEGLEPDTTYRYQVVMGDEASTERSFSTAPEPGTPTSLRITAFGDHGVEAPTGGGDGSAPVENTALAASLEPTMHLVPGDLSYADGDETLWPLYTDQIEGFASQVPFMTVPGNHEREPEHGFDQYDARFHMPSDEGEGWWSIQYGNVQIVGIDSERACEQDDASEPDASEDRGRSCQTTESVDAYEPQLRFVNDTLQAGAEDPGIDWQIVLVHHVLWSSSARHGPSLGLVDHYLPLFDAHGVDIVIQGHNHVYERTHTIREGASAEEGTVYVTNGIGGFGTYGFQEEKPAWSASRTNESYGTLVLDLEPETMQGRFIALDGTVVDRFEHENVPDGGVQEFSGAVSPTPGDDQPSMVPGPALLVGLSALICVAWWRRPR